MHHSQAIAAQPSAEAKAKLHGHLGDVYRLSGQRHRSRDACSNALALQPAYTAAVSVTIGAPLSWQEIFRRHPE